MPQDPVQKLKVLFLRVHDDIRDFVEHLKETLT